MTHVGCACCVRCVERYYPSKLTDWWCDDWVTTIYGNSLARVTHTHTHTHTHMHMYMPNQAPLMRQRGVSWSHGWVPGRAVWQSPQRASKGLGGASVFRGGSGKVLLPHA